MVVQWYRPMFDLSSTFDVRRCVMRSSLEVKSTSFRAVSVLFTSLGCTSIPLL